MPTFYERACKLGSWQGPTGGALDLVDLRDAMVLYASGLVDAARAPNCTVG